MAIEVGDAIFKFLGDSTNLDAAFDNVGPKATAAMNPATRAAEGLGDALEDTGRKAEGAADEVEVASKRSTTAMREARAEVGLLGEEFGIRLPRHVRSFVAELPGVGEALSAAFSATAVLFLAEALIKASEKLSDFASSTFIYTAALKEAHGLLVAENLEIAKQADLYNKAAAALSLLSDLRTPYQRLQDLLKAQNAELDRLAFKQGEYARTTAAEDQARARALQEQIKLTEAQIVTQALADKDKGNADHLKDLQQEIELRKKLAEVQVTSAEVVNGLSKENADEIRYQISLKALQALANAEAKFGKDSENKVRELNASIEALQADHALKTTEELNKQKDETLKLLDEMQKSVVASGGVEIILPRNVQALLNFRAEAQALGVTLGVDLVEKINLAKQALADYTDLGGKDAKQIDVLKEKIQQLEKEYDHLGQVQDKEKLKSETTWAGFIQDVQRGINVSHELSVDLQGAFNTVSSGLQNAFQMAIAGEKGYGAALEEATAKALQSLAAQAAVKAIFYTAEGFAELAFGVTSSSALELFEAAGLMASVAGAAGLAGRAIGGGGGGSGNNNGNNPQGLGGRSNTSGTGLRGGTSVKAFAEGGLITMPTLAMMGEGNRKEAVLPLEDPQAMGEIGKAIGQQGGGGLTVHVHGHVIGANDVAHLVGLINKRVNRGQVTLKASNSLRITKRSA
jgi:hypothetical protein